MNGKKSNLFSWKKLKHRSNGKLQFADSSSMNSIASDNFRNADPSRSGYVPVDSKAVEATELMALARFYEKLCSNKAHQSSTSLSTTTAGTTTVPGLDTSNFLHVISSHHLNTTANNGNAAENVKHSSGSDSALHIPVFRVAQRRSHGMQDVCLSITPLDENYFDLSKEHTSAVLQTIDTLVATALQLTVTSAFHHDSADTSRPPMVVNSNYEPLFEPTTVTVSNRTSIYSNINNNINNIRINSNDNDISNSNNNNNGSISVIDKSGEISSAVSSNTSLVENSPSQPPTSNISPTSSSNSANFSSTTGVTSSSANISAVRRSILLRSKADPYYTKPKGDLKRVQFTLPPLGSDEDCESNDKYADSCSVALDSSSSSLPLGTDTTARDYRHKAAEYLYDDYDNMQDEKESLKRKSIRTSGGGCIASQLQSTSSKACTFLNPEDIDEVPSTEMSDECYSDEEEDSTIGHSSIASIFSADTQPVGLFCSSISTSTRDVATTACNSVGFQPSECLFLQPQGELTNTSKNTVEKSPSLFIKNTIEGSHKNRKKQHQSKSYVEDRNDHHSQNAAPRVEESTPEGAESDRNKDGRAMTVYYSFDGKERLEEIATEYSLSGEEEDGDEEKGYSSKDDATADGYMTDDTATTATTSGYYSNTVPTEESAISQTCSAQSGSNTAATSTEDDFDTDVGNDDETTKNMTDESRDDSEFTWQASFPSKEFTEENVDGTSTRRATEMEYLDLSNDEAGEDVLDKIARLGVLSPTTKIKPIKLSNSSRGSTEEGAPGTATKQVSTTSSTEKVKTYLNVMIDDCDQPNPTTPNANTKTTPTKSAIGWSILSPKKLLTFGTSPSSMSKAKNYSTSIGSRHNVEWNKPGLDNSGSSPKKSSIRAASTILTSNRKVRSPSPSPRFLIKTVVHSSVGGMKSSYE
jgi:hypothetical protein